MIGALPSGLFGLAKPAVAPVQDLVSTQPAEPFVYGAGGARLTPDMIAQRSRMAQGMMAAGMDTSPVGSWTQGLARVAQSLVGTMQQGRLDQAAQQNMTADQQILKSLTEGGGNDAASLAAISSPYVSDPTRDALKMQWQATHKTPAQPHYWETNNGSLAMVGPDGKPQVLYDDPTPKINWITAENRDGTKTLVPVGPDGPIQKGGGQAISPPTAPVGKLTPITGGAPSQGARTFPVR